MDHKKIIVYQTKNGSIELSADIGKETVWATQKQISDIFGVTPQNITIHLKNIFESGELDKKATCKESLQVQKEGSRTVKRKVQEYNLEVLISVGYRIDSIMGTRFRQWATQTLKDHITQGFTINPQKIEENRQAFFKAIEDIKILTYHNQSIQTHDVLELIQSFSYTWFSLDQYDKDSFPRTGTKKEVIITAEDLQRDLQKLKSTLITKNEATELFGQEKQKGSLQGIVGNVFQSVFGQDAYETVEEKAAHLLYFIIKNHPFNDGNKRSGAFSFIWFLQKAGFDFQDKINPETLATLTILIAESNPKDKDKMIGIVLLLLNVQK